MIKPRIYLKLEKLKCLKSAISVLLVKMKNKTKQTKMVAMFQRHDLWEQKDHITANFRQYSGILLLERGTPVLLKK